MHGKVDHLTTQNLKNKRIPGKEKKNNQMNYHFYVLCFTHLIQVALYKLFCLWVFDGDMF